MKNSRKRNRVTNITPADCEIKVRAEGFELWFYSPINGKYSPCAITKIHFQSWWLSYLARLLWKVIHKRKEDINADIAAMEGKQ